MKSLFPILLLMSLTTITFANNVLPVANITSSTGSFSAKIGQTFTFSGATSYDPDGGGINYYWWYVDGVQKKAGSTASSFTYDPGIVGNGSTNRTFQLMLKVRDNEYSTKTKTVTVTIQADKRNYFVTDHLGNVRAMVDQSGAVIGGACPELRRRNDYYPYGQVMPGRSSNTANANDIYKFTGHERDAELGLDYMLARNYDPEIGRFLSVDPEYQKRSWVSPYNYAQNNPILRFDPTGGLDEYVFDPRSGKNRKISNKGGDKTDYYHLGKFLTPNLFLTRETFISERQSGLHINSFRFSEGENTDNDGVKQSITTSWFHSPTHDISGWFIEPGGPDSNVEGSDQRIPAGSYILQLTTSGKYPMELISLLQNFSRTNIKVHSGNFGSQTAGCPMPQSQLPYGGSVTKTGIIKNELDKTGSGNVRIFNVSGLGGRHSQEDDSFNDDN